ncbi:GlsB/YeaQ/YmgE family stress response membrane protein [Kocuria rhizophila]|uniref:GlsB/YeaQ/YmgE family stress response membrane protein n=1 Tax=Kocuria rhizophila TaxID=72000 RepID=UPI003AEF2E0C
MLEQRKLEVEKMGIFSWIILGLIAGALAKLILPGKQGGGIIVTIILGIVGAFLGGWLGSFIPGLHAGIDEISIGTIITSVIGAIIVLLIYGFVVNRRR